MDFNDDIMNYITDLKNEISKKENMNKINQNEAASGKKLLPKIKKNENDELKKIIETFKKKLKNYLIMVKKKIV